MQDDKLYAIAMTCEKIKSQGCTCECGVCQYNVFNYVKDVREAALLKATAQSDFHQTKQIESDRKTYQLGSMLGPFIGIGLIILLILFCCHGCKRYDNPTQTIPTAQIKDTVQYYRVGDMPVDTDVRYLLNHPNEIENINRVLRVMHRYGVRDMNRDGLVNCIDYSITFRNLYGSYAHIIINRNDHVGMNHMFIMLYYPQQLHIEPQGDENWYTMGQVWGVMYEPYYNKDVTNIWGQYIGY